MQWYILKNSLFICLYKFWDIWSVQDNSKKKIWKKKFLTLYICCQYFLTIPCFVCCLLRKHFIVDLINALFWTCSVKDPLSLDRFYCGPLFKMDRWTMCMRTELSWTCIIVGVVGSCSHSSISNHVNTLLATVKRYPAAILVTSTLCFFPSLFLSWLEILHI